MEVSLKISSGHFSLISGDKVISWCSVSQNAIMPHIDGFDKGEIAQMMGFGTSRDFLRQGYGTKLIELIKIEAPEKGFKVLVLGVYEENFSAIKMYEKCNFERYSQRGSLIFMKHIL